MIEIKIETASDFDKNKSWWNKLLIDDRRKFYIDSGICDLGFLNYKWDKLPFPHQVMINRYRR